MKVGDLVFLRSTHPGWHKALCVVVGRRPHTVTKGAHVLRVKSLASGEERWAYMSNVMSVEEQSDEGG